MTDTIKELIAAGEDAEKCFTKEAGLCWSVRCNLGKVCIKKARFKNMAWLERPAIKAMQAENTRLREKLGEILTIAADADDDVIANLAREGLDS